MTGPGEDSGIERLFIYLFVLRALNPKSLWLGSGMELMEFEETYELSCRRDLTKNKKTRANS